MKAISSDKLKFLYFLILAFVFIASTALLISKKPVIYLPVFSQEKKVYSDLPLLSKNYSPFPVISAQGALVIDLGSSVSLYEKNPDAELLPASTTKIITALVAMDYYFPDWVLEVPEIQVDGQKMGLVKGEKIKALDLFYGLLVYSANDAAQAFAQNFPGGEKLFVSAMNFKAKQLHLNRTNFKNPTGLDGNTQRTTARDLVRVAEVAMKDPLFAKIVGTKEITVRSVDGKIVHKLTNINQLLGTVDGVKGVKTGWTENARENLVTYIERGERKIMIVTLGSQDRFGETKELIDWIFANYKWNDVTFPSDDYS